MSRRTRSFLFDNVNGKLLTDVAFTIKQIADSAEGSESVKSLVSNTDAKTALSVTDTGGDGSLAYNNTTGVITYTGPSAANVRAHFSAGTGIGITDGAISTSITQYTDALARGAVSVTDSGGDGSLAYNNSTGVITYTGPSAANVRAHFSASTGISITDGAISTSITQYTDTLARAAFSAGTGITLTSGVIAADTTVMATKQYVDEIAQGLHTHDSCNAATNTTLASISGGTITYNNGTSGVGATLTTTGSYTTIDGVTLSNGMRILVKNEATAAHNGIYDRTSSTVLTRSDDFNTPAEMAGGDFTFISAGTLYNNTGWVMTDVVTTVGTTSVDWIQFSGAGTFTAGTGLTLTGNSFSVNAAQTQITSVGTLTALTVSGTTSLPSTTSIGDVSSTELGYLDGVTSAIQTQLGTKLNSSAVSAFGLTLVDDADAATARTTLGLGNVTNESKATMFSSPTFTGTVVLPSTTSIGDVSSTELGYLDGVTSAIQTQLNSKASTGKAIAMAIVFGG